jgi:hypothetical protein
MMKLPLENGCDHVTVTLHGLVAATCGAAHASGTSHATLPTPLMSDGGDKPTALPSWYRKI